MVYNTFLFYLLKGRAAIHFRVDVGPHSAARGRVRICRVAASNAGTTHPPARAASQLTSHDAPGTPRKLSHNLTVPSIEPDSNLLLWTARVRTAPVCPASSLMQRIIL